MLRSSRLAVLAACLATAAGAFAAPNAPSSGDRRTLTFDERVAAQRAIEGVYWKHREWPESNAGGKPALDAVMPDEVVRAKVTRYLQESSALATVWGRPVTAADLQHELDRMSASTKAADVLAEIYDALGNDPFVIAETLGRQTFADRAAREAFDGDSRIHDAVRREAQAAAAALQGLSDSAAVQAMRADPRTYREITWRRGAPAAGAADAVTLDAAEWRAFERALASSRGSLEESDRAFFVRRVVDRTADTITTAAMVWPKTTFDAWLASSGKTLSSEIEPPGGSYTVAAPAASAGCTLDTWNPTAFAGLSPARRWRHTAVWTGTAMVIWGGVDETGAPLADGSRYVPATDTWNVTADSGAPSARYAHTAVWSGTEMIVWGGRDAAGAALGTGARYDPTGDVWRPLTSNPLNGAPAARFDHTAVWSGTQMIVWGGNDGSTLRGDGARYAPAFDNWTAMPLLNAPSARVGHTAVWDGIAMDVWGGFDGTSYLGDGGQYDPRTNNWTTLDSGAAGVPSPRAWHTAVVDNGSGSERRMIVWGGTDGVNVFGNGSTLEAGASNSWTPLPSSGAPSARSRHTAVWSPTTRTMFVWGGTSSAGVDLADGGAYAAAAASWSAIPTSPAAGRLGHTAVWTGAEMVVWGGTNAAGTVVFGDGARYKPATGVPGTWTSLAATPRPARRTQHTAIWTGTEMIVWGGLGADGLPAATGDRYNAATNSWTPVSLTGAPSGRTGHTAVWTGTAMIVWGGQAGGTATNDGAIYKPAQDGWSPVSSNSLPLAALRNGDFEQSGFPGDATIPVPPGGTAITSWIVSGNGVLYVPIAVWQASSGRWSVGLNNGDSGTISQNLTTVAGAAYIVTFDMAGDPTNAPAIKALRVTAAGASADYQFDTTGRSASAMGWQSMVFNFTATSGSTTLSFQSLTSGIGGPAVDNVKLKLVEGRPSPRARHTAVWTGTDMIVWGGDDGQGNYLRDGGRYTVAGDGWTSLPAPGSPTARSRHTAIWNPTLGRMIVWGGWDGTAPLATGAEYTPGTNQWSTINAVGPVARYGHAAVWTGTKTPGSSTDNQMIVWGGIVDATGSVTATGGVYTPATGLWKSTTSTGAPSGRSGPMAVWSGGEMVVWGGRDAAGVPLGDGGRYALQQGTWSATTMSGAPVARGDATAVYTGAEMIVFGGAGAAGGPRADGSRYCACLSVSTFYRDADGDGFGDPNSPLRTCDTNPPPGYVLIDSTHLADCNDANGAIHPGAFDACDGIDNDCNGHVDDTYDPDGDNLGWCVDNAPVVYNPDQRDYDGDGVGDASDNLVLAADIDGSGTVDGFDLARVAQHFGSFDGDAAFERTEDFDRNGRIDGEDLSTVAAQFGQSIFLYPVAPQNFTLTFDGVSTATLTWTPTTSDRAIGYTVWRAAVSLAAPPAVPDRKWVAIAILPSGASSYVDTGLLSNYRYRYRVAPFSSQTAAHWGPVDWLRVP